MTAEITTNNRLDELTANIKLKLVENKVASNIFNRTINQNSVEIGKSLMQAKKFVPYKQWQIWLDDNFKMTKQAAGNYIRVAEKFGNLKNVFHFEDFQFAALIELSRLTPAELQNFIDAQESAGVDPATLSVRKLQAAIKKFLPPKKTTRQGKVETVKVQTVYQFPLFELPRLPATEIKWLIPAPMIDIAARAGLNIRLDFSRNVKPMTHGVLVTKKFFSVENGLSQIADAVISTPPVAFTRSDGTASNFKCYIWFFGGADFQPFKVFGNLFFTQKSPRNSAGK